MVAAVNLQRDAGLMSSNLQILCQFVTSLQQMSSEVLSLGLGQVVFPSQEVATLSPAPRAPRAARYMSAMGLWHPLAGPGDPGPLPVSSYNECMNCRHCFLNGPGTSGTYFGLFCFGAGESVAGPVGFGLGMCLTLS